jgi:hypothetical protein
MNGLIYHIALQARNEDLRAAAARSAERPTRRRLFRRSF